MERSPVDQREYHTLILAGLLHDIGKLLNKPKPEEGKPHAVYSYEFLKQDDIACLLQQKCFARDLDFDALCGMVLHHDPHIHGYPATQAPADLLRIIRLADGYSAGERSWTDLEGRPARGDLALDSIFTKRDLGRPLPESRPLYKPAILSPEQAFPHPDVKALTGGDYWAVQEGFREAYRYALSQAYNWTELEAWTYSLLERYTWAVPSALQKDPRDVSLFDHARTSCAIAAALYLYRRADKQDRGGKTFVLIKGDVSGVQDYIYSVANVGPGGVAKRLRARSFFITALTEIVSHRLRDELVDGYTLPIAATIFAGGGQFVLLAPNRKSVLQNLARIERDVNQWLWDEFQGDLAVVFGCEEVSGNELAIKREKGRNVCHVLEALDKKVEEAKVHRLGCLLQESGQWRPGAFVWAPTDKDYKHGACPSCDRLPAQAGEEEPDVDRRLCLRCRNDRWLSEHIVEARFVAYWHDTLGYKGDSDWLKRRQLALFGGKAQRHAVLLSDLDELARFEIPPYQLDGLGYDVSAQDEQQRAHIPLIRHFANYVPRFDSLDELTAFCTAERACVHGDYTDRDTCGTLVRPDGSDVGSEDFPILQTFGCISAAAAEWPDHTLGIQLLGVLRADVDNLGLLFTRSFEEEIRRSKGADVERQPVRSLSRLATLSRMTDLFFSGWVNQALACPPEGKRYNRIYTVYAGGDDLCLVGPWDVLIDFARYMAGEFERYVAGNPNVTLSAGIAVTKPKFPIATSARKAGALLQAAKNAGRNRLNLFGVIARWSEKPDEWIGLSEELKRQPDEEQNLAMLSVGDLWTWAELLDEELGRWRESESVRYPISASFAHRLLGYAEMARHWEETGEIHTEDLLYLAHLAYDLGRNVAQSDAVPEETKRRLSRLTHLSNRAVMAGLRLPITYALYRNRERSRER